MVEDIFFTDDYFVDCERDTLLLEVRVDYLDEIFKILKIAIISVTTWTSQFINTYIGDLDKDSGEYGV